MQCSVYVQSMRKEGARIVVEATNGSPEGPPFVKFELRADKIEGCHIGKRYVLTIEEGQ